jgi:membrane protease subunit HflK
MPWNDNSKPGPWNSPTGDSQPPPEPADKTAPGGARPDAGAPKANDRDTPWRDTPKLRRDQPDDERRRSNSPKTQSPPPRGPDLEELSRLLKARLTQVLGQGQGRRIGPRLLVAGAIAALGLWTLTGFYRVEPGQQAAVMQFGAYAGLAGPGLGYHLPVPFGWARKVSLSNVNRLEIGGSGADETPSGGLMLTRDGGLAEVDYTVQWRVADTAKYLFDLNDPDGAVKRAAESAMREAMARTPLAEVLDAGRASLQGQVQALMQAELNRAGAGVGVVGVQVRNAEPPQAVAPAYRDAATARQDAEAGIADAEAYRTRVVGDAKAEATRLLLAAQGYRDQEIAEAAGEAARFDQVDAQYRHAPLVTRQRIYIETMEHVLRASNKVVVDANGHSTVVLPPELFKSHVTPDAGSARTPSSSQPTAGAPPPGQTQGQAQTPDATQSAVQARATGNAQ